MAGEASGGTGTGQRNPAARSQDHGHQPMEGESEASGHRPAARRSGGLGLKRAIDWGIFSRGWEHTAPNQYGGNLNVIWNLVGG